MLSKNFILWKIFVIVVVPVLFSISCVRTQNTDADKENANNITNAATTRADEDSIFYLIPSPGEILERIQGADIVYNEDVLNPVSNKDKYFGSTAQSLNLGVYFSDMAYTTLFERAGKSVDYLGAIQYLSDEVGISSSVFESLASRARANAGKMDSLFSISNEAYNDLVEFLESVDRENTIIFLSAGAYIESIYLAFQSVEDYSPENKATSFIGDLKYPLESILERAGSVKDDESITEIINLLNPLDEKFKEAGSTEQTISVNKDTKGEITIGGGKVVTLNEKDYDELKVLTTEIRTKVVGY